MLLELKKHYKKGKAKNKIRIDSITKISSIDAKSRELRTKFKPEIVSTVLMKLN